MTGECSRTSRQAVPIEDGGVALIIEDLNRSRCHGVVFVEQIDWISRNCEVQVVLESGATDGVWAETVCLVEKHVFSVLNLDKLCGYATETQHKHFQNRSYGNAVYFFKARSVPDKFIDVFLLEKLRPVLGQSHANNKNAS
jgi:hypothetical protein